MSGSAVAESVPSAETGTNTDDSVVGGGVVCHGGTAGTGGAGGGGGFESLGGWLGCAGQVTAVLIGGTSGEGGGGGGSGGGGEDVETGGEGRVFGTGAGVAKDA